MQFEELKNNMSRLEQVLSKTNHNIKTDRNISETAHSKILRIYQKNVINCSVIAIVFGLLWAGNVNIGNLPGFYQAFIFITCVGATIWYIFLCYYLKRIKITEITPLQLFIKATRLKLMTISGELFFVGVLALFFSLFLIDMYAMNLIAFWLVVGFLIIGAIISAVYIWPRYAKLFRDLNSIKE